MMTSTRSEEWVPTDNGDPAAHNVVSGSAEAVVQANDIHGGVHLHSPSRTSRHLDETLDGLAAAVFAQWDAEHRRRRVHDPFPLPVHWVNAPEDLIDHWANIRSGATDPVDLSGRVDEVKEIFERVPSRRLVVLGEAGSGKTVLSIRLLLDNLDPTVRRSGDPVPLLFSLGSWHPSTTDLHSWMAAELVRDHPALAERISRGTTLASALVGSGRILPILDGFDEIPADLQADALRELNLTSSPLVLVSRTTEYAEAIEATDVLTAAASIVLQDLDIGDLTAYLPRTTRKLPGRPGATKWDEVLVALNAGTPAARRLLKVLSTPLMVSLARTTYSDHKGRDPADLLGFPGEPEVRDHLLDAFLDPVTKDSLRFLSTHMHRLGTRNLAWWELATAVPRAVMGVVAGLSVLLVVWSFSIPLLMLGTWTPASRTAWSALAQFIGVFGGLVTFATFAGLTLGLGVRSKPARTRLRLGRARRMWQLDDGHTLVRTALWFGGWCASGLVAGRMLEAIANTRSGIGLGVLAGAGIATGVWLVVGLTRLFSDAVPLREEVSPRLVLATDRRAALRQGVLVGFGGAGVVCVVVSALLQHLLGLASGIGVWLLTWLSAGSAGVALWIIYFTAWGPWLVARCWLSARRQLPWHTMRFLQEAHRVGALRQVGSVYQFRHAELQDHLLRV